MSAVLPMPRIPSQYAESFKDPQFVEDLIDFVLNNPKISEAFGLKFDLRLIEVHNLLHRVAKLEHVTGLVDNSDHYEDRILTIPEQIDQKIGMLENITSAVVPRTSLEQKATEFALYVRDNATKTGKPYLDSKEIMSFLKNDLPEPLRMGNIQNPRQFKKDVIEKAKDMFPFISLSKKKNGRRNVRVVYEPGKDTVCPNRMDAYIRSKPT